MKNVEDDPKRFGKVGVLMGGLAECEISMMSGNATLDALIRQGVDAHCIKFDSDICTKLAQEKFDRVFVAMHGMLGEDGTIQGVLETLKIPYTGSGIVSSALSMAKEKTKLIWNAVGISTPPFVVVKDVSCSKVVLEKLKLPLAIKPTCEGSSIGITKVTDPGELDGAIKKALEYHEYAMAEQWIDGDEFAIGILGNDALPVIRITTPVGFYDYHAKYFTETTGYHIPSGLSKSEEVALQQLSLEAYSILDCRHWARVDAMRDGNGKFWLLELNTIPGLTSHSLVPKAANDIGIGFDELILKILEQTLS